MSHQRALTIRSDKGILRVLQSEIGVSLPFLGEPPKDNEGLVIKTFKGIWDTGATGTVITKKVVEALELKPTGQAEIHTADGKSIKNTYLVNIHLPMNLGIQNVKVTEGVLHSDTDLLIGMDIITLGDFSITHSNGQTVMSFGIPSCESVDYVQKINQNKPKIGRNDKCFCGSEKKYKHCHGKT